MTVAGTRPDFYASVEQAWRERRAFGAAAERFEVVNQAGDVAYGFSIDQARRWAERQTEIARGEADAEIPHREKAETAAPVERIPPSRLASTAQALTPPWT